MSDLYTTKQKLELVHDFAFLNQARAGLWLAHAWFLSMASVRKLQYVCVSTPEAINN